MLSFLDTLCGALIARDADRIRLLLAHPLARALPAPVRAEAVAIASGHRRRFVAPLQALRLYHQTAQLLAPGAVPRPAARSGGEGAPVERRQMELPLEPVAAGSR